MNRISGRIMLLIAAFMLFLIPVAALGAGTFDDVASDNVFKSDIEWLASVGVTKGCNPPANTRFCPDQPVTRAQMAAFIHRLADGVVTAKTALSSATADHATNADHAISADELDQKDAAMYRTIIAGNACDGSGCPTIASGSMDSFAPVTIDVPMSGVLSINYSLSAHNSVSSRNLLETWVAVDKTANDGCGLWVFGPIEDVVGTANFLFVDGNITAVTGSGASVVEVGTGTHTVKVCAMTGDGVAVDSAGLNVTWSAEGSGLSMSAANHDLANIEELKAYFGENPPKLNS